MWNKFSPIWQTAQWVLSFFIKQFQLLILTNLLLKTQSTPNTPHIDYPDPHIVLLYYVNDSSGPTTFYNRKFKVKKEVMPKKGRILIFDGSIYHSSTPPTTNDYRCVINFDLKS